ncbi:MAG: hypothetical protein J6A19_06285 [Oscillospiraceae bacterium]|nr:hypothetical protein [Oscillospiraceae bacterium]
MSLEPGGRADKYGNNYENKYLANLFLRLVLGELQSVTVEPLGKNKDSVEYIAVDKDNIEWHYQCKLSNGIKDKWTISDLSSYDVFSRAREIIETNPHNRYVFVSPLSYGELPELCKRAGTNSSVEDFLNYQLTNDEIKKTFREIIKKYGLDADDKNQVSALLSILSKCDFATIPCNIVNTHELISKVGTIFMGEAEGARVFLENYINSNGRYGVPITADEIISAMDKQGFPFRKHIFGENNIPKIKELNSIFLNSFQPINDTVIHRSETDRVLDEIAKGNSVILHGKAGVGKSGCVYEIVNKLNETNTLFLGLKLDKMVPETSTDHFGEKLGFKQSPVYCLHNIAAGKPCVLILDQLDALRWTSRHSGTALEICKQLIYQAKTLNKVDGGHISLLFITRTFDLENDAGLKALFAEKEKDKVAWSRIEINAFSKEDVIIILGDEYLGLSRKLQQLLLMPSSLYIWTSLTNHSAAQGITTPFELMDKWWDQILNNCEDNGICKERIASILTSFVNKLEASSESELPKRIFPDYTDELQMLTSCGLLIENNNAISFSHQSFLDHFAVSGMLEKIYSGSSILDVIGSFDEQTPYIRYRLIRVLQIMLDNQSLYIGKCTAILKSENVRHYFKCTVFEVIGQCENPSNGLLDFVYSYFANQDWRDYVFNTVYWGHPQFIVNLDTRREFSWQDKEGLDLLYSINTKAQDFLLDKLKPMCFKNAETDYMVYNTLSRNCATDSPEILELRLELLEAHIDLLANHWTLPNSKNESKNLIPILKLITKYIDSIKEHLYFGKEDDVIAFSKCFYREIVKELLPEICNKTKQFSPRFPNFEFSDSFKRWTKSTYNHHSARYIVEIAKISLCEFASKEPEAFMIFVEEFDGNNSVVYHEILANAILGLGVVHSDYAISWLCADPENHFFIYTENREDYLSLTKKIIGKFSPACSIETFRRLEDIILHWSDPTATMVETYKRRVMFNKENRYHHVYFAFWGHLQKELLPCLDTARITDYSKRLIQALNRNEWLRTPYYKSGLSTGRAMSVKSPVSHKAKTISDKTWLKIISVPNNKMNGYHEIEKNGYYVRADHITFSDSLSVQAKQNPTRFAKLSLSFPQDCYFGYITGVISAIYKNDESITNIDFSLVCNVVNRYISHSDSNVITEILRLIERKAEENWPNNIIRFVCDAAMNSPDPSPDFTVFYEKSKPCSPHSLLTNAINCVRGCALQTLSQLLWEHKELSEQFKPVVKKAINDSNEAVRFSAISFIFPYYNLDKEFCINTLKELIEKEIRTLGYYDIWDIICCEYSNIGEFFTSSLIKACCSGIEELDVIAAGYLCAAAIYYDFDIAEQIYKLPLNDNQIDRICRQAVYSFNQEEFHQNSKDILLHFLDEGKTDLFAFSQLFYDNYVDLDRDEDLLLKLLSAKLKEHHLHTILDYINTNAQDIERYAKILHSICEGMLKNEMRDTDTIANDLIKSVIKLLDANKHNPEIKAQCLEMWDIIYKSSYKSSMPFSQIIDNLI